MGGHMLSKLMRSEKWYMDVNYNIVYLRQSFICYYYLPRVIDNCYENDS